MSDPRGKEVVIAIDPGVKGCGVALFSNGVLKKAGYITTGPRPPSFWTAGGAFEEGSEVCFILEKPQVYKTRLLKGDPNDLIDVAVAGGEMLGLMLAATTALVPVSRHIIEKINPAVWKRQLPKEVVQARLKKILTDIEKTTIEKTTTSLMHNVWDAVGIGLWGVKRFHT